MYRKILLTLDGSPLARTAIAQAATLASGSEAIVEVLQVIDPISVLELQALGEDEEVGQSIEAVADRAKGMHFVRRDAALQEVATAKQQLEANGVHAVTTTVLDGLAGNEIVDHANANNVDAIVMATRGHGGLGREVVGSVAEFVLRHAGNSAVILVGPRAASRPSGSRLAASGA